MGQEPNDGTTAARRRTLDDAPLVGVLHWTLSGGVTHANDALLGMLGYTREDLREGRLDWFAATPEEWRAADAGGMVQVRERGRHEPFEKEFFRQDGTRVRVLIGSALYPDSDHEGVSFALDLSGREATERGALERAVRHRIEGVLESITDAFVSLDADGRVTYMNAEAERLAGAHRNTIIGRPHRDVWPAGIGDEVERRCRRVAEERTPTQFEGLHEGDGARVWLGIRAFPAADGGINLFYRDITTEKDARDAAERAAADLRLVTDAAPLLISYVGADLRYRFVNKGYTDWFGRPAAQVVGRTVTEVIGAAAWEAARARVEAVLGGERVTYEALLPYGEGADPRYVHIDLVPDADDGGRVRGYVTVVADVTERRRAEEEARERERRRDFLADLTEATRDLLDPEELLWRTAEAVGEFVGASRCTYAEIENGQTEDATLTVRRDYTRGEHIRSVAGTWPLLNVGEEMVASLRAGEIVASGDTRNDPRTQSEVAQAAFAAIQARAVLAVPVNKAGELVGAVILHQDTPRAWTHEETELLVTVAERTWLALENARLRRGEREAAERQRRFLREMLFGLTEGHLRLLDRPDELPAALPPACDPVDLSPSTLRLLRKQVGSMTQELRFTKERRQDFETAVGEAAMNAVRHGDGGRLARVHADAAAGTIQVWVRDEGEGIAEHLIHRAVESGWTTGGFGAGFYLMRQTCDRVYLLTGPTGTTVVLEMDREPPLPAWLQATNGGTASAGG